MKKIMISEENIIFYYGNKAGYIRDDHAVVDFMFQHEALIEFLTKENHFNIEWKDGIFDALVSNSAADAIGLKACRIHQLNPEVDARMKFISYDELIMRGFGKPNAENYTVVFDGEIETNDLHKIYDKFNLSHPHGYSGHSLSMSDIIELYDDKKSLFYYVDAIGFKEIAFEKNAQEFCQSNITKDVDACPAEERSTELSPTPQPESNSQPRQARQEHESYTFTL